MNHVDGLVLEQLFIVGIDLRAFDAVFPGGLLGALLDDVAEGDHFHVGQLLQRGHVLAVGDAAAADDTDSYLIHFERPPLV